jgi:hypothetical protein
MLEINQYKTAMNEPQSLLQRFFDASLIPSETTDERLKHYQAAAADLAKRFGESPRDAVSASRVATDPNCPATDPWFNTVQEVVKVHWKTFLVKNHDEPRQICRAILLEALSKATEADSIATLAIWNASSSLLPHLGDGPEQAITRGFISALGDKSEAISSSQWRIGVTATENILEFEIKLPAIKAIQVDEAELRNGFSDAAGPHDQQSKSYGNPNQYWSGNNQHWAWQFAPRAASAVANSVNKALSATSPAIEGLSKQLTPALKKHANALGKWVMDSAQRNERFTALLWWKQALYSPSLQRSYRKLSPVGTIIALAFDLGSVSGAPVPLSVEYFLRETIRNVLPENPKLTLAELVAATKTDDAVNPCLPVAPNGPPHRISLREFLSVVRRAVPANETIPAYTGVVPSTSLPVSEWAVWLLRERLAEILTAPKV